MSDQELDFDHQETCAERCRECGTMKRRRNHRHSSPSDEENPLLHGFARLSLPMTSLLAPSSPAPWSGKFLNASTPVDCRRRLPTLTSPEKSPATGFPLVPTTLHRSGSDPIAFSPYESSLSPENGKNFVPAAMTSAPKATSSFPPLPMALRRTISDPTSFADMVTPPRSSKEKCSDPISDESPNAKRVKRMKDRMKEMSKWWDQVIREEDENPATEDNNDTATKDDPDDDAEAIPARVGTAENCHTIHFTCPCGKPYEILLSGNRVYYMLMPASEDESDTESEEKIWIERTDKYIKVKTTCPCSKGYRILLSGNECFYRLI